MDLKGAEIRNIKDLCMDIGKKDRVPMKINIPYYQRPYKWGKDQINNLIVDFFKNKADNSQAEYFVGSVVMVKNARGSVRHDIIDGQQRITTVFLLNYLRFIILRAYIEELIHARRTSIESFLMNFRDCYENLLGDSKNDAFKRMQEYIVEKLDTINDCTDECREEIYEDALKYYQNCVALPPKDFSDLRKYQRDYEKKLFEFLEQDELALVYSRASYNQNIKEALSKIMVIVSKDKNPEFKLTSETKEKSIINQYTEAIKLQFEKVKSIASEYSSTPLEHAKNMIKIIDDMIENIKFCVIMTGNEKDAYTLFEVLNDRALEIDDLELIKNLYFKEYCTKSGDGDDLIDKNIELLDNIWGDETFTREVGKEHSKLISYLGTIFLTANEEIFTNKLEKYRQVLENDYFDKYFGLKTNKYSYVKVFNDITVYQMIKVMIVDEFQLHIKNTVNDLIEAENSNEKSITYKTFHLLNTLGLNGVMPALTNIIIRKYIDTYVADGKKIDIVNFRKYVNDIINDKHHDNNQFEEIHKWSYEIWKATLYAKDYNIPREIAKDIISKVNINKNDFSAIVLGVDMVAEMQKQFDEWIFEWQYGKKLSDAKVKVLFINLFKTDRTETGLKINRVVHTFNTEKLQLDHLEASKYDTDYIEKYFIPKDVNEHRNRYVDCLGNIMILDSDNNNNKDNKPLFNALGYYENMSANHWLINEIKDMINSDTYSEIVMIGETEHRIPTESFFTERRKRLQKYFKAMLNRKLKDTEMLLL